MLRMESGCGAPEVNRLLNAARVVIAGVHYCWLTTEDSSDGVNVRPMGRVSSIEDNENWCIRFVTDRRSRKVADIRRSARSSLIFQSNRDNGFVTLIGKATLIESASDVNAHWRNSFNAYFQSEVDRANAAFIDVDINCMELWIRDVTPEPFGLHPTRIQKDANGAWQIAHKSHA
jgi:general stress protein 26